MALLNSGFYTANFDILPPQMIPLKEKLKVPDDDEKSWGEQCMDSLETIGKSQYSSNLKLVENYEMIKGRFIYNHYFETEGYSSMINQISAEFELPNYLRHYDIISPVINTLSGEWQKRPDLFKVRQVGERASNEYLRTKIDLTKKNVFAKINAEINKRLIEQGVDPNKDDFQSEEEQQQYVQQLEAYRQQMTPQEIQKFMDTSFLTQAERWGQHQIEFNKEYYNLPEKEKTEFEDMLVADRCFRHFYITATGRNEETWNPVNTFFHKSPDVKEIENGDFVGRNFLLTINTILDRYGHRMSKEDFDKLKGIEKEDNTKWNDREFNWVYQNYFVPFQGYPAYDIMRTSWNKYSDGEVPFIDDSFFSRVDEGQYNYREGFYFVTEAYWKTQEKIIKITYLSEETGDKVVRLVDENFIIPDYFVESTTPFDEDQDINTYVSTYVPRVWKGVKINTSVDKKMKKDLYLGIGPNEFQFKGDYNIYGAKLPVCGQVFSVRNSKSMSLVDMMKPYQIGYNVFINQLYQLAEKEIGMFVVMDMNMFPNSKDWGGEDSWEKWMLIAKNLGLLPADTSPTNIKQSVAAVGGFLPKVIDLNLAAQMVSRMNMAKFFEEQALRQVGFNDYRIGAFSSNATATGVQQGMEKSYSQTESLFTNFSNYLRRCYQMSLDLDQYVQSQKEEISFTYVKSDLSRAFVKILGTDLMLSELGVFVSNSQEHARQLDMMRRYALENNTAGLTPPDVADVIMMNTPGEIKRQLEVSYSKIMEQQNRMAEIQQEKISNDKELELLKIQQVTDEGDKDRENKLDVKRIEVGADVINSDTQIPDNSASEKLDVQKQVADSNASIQRDRLSLDKQKAQAELEFKNKKLSVEQSKIQAQLQIQNKETETAKILKGKQEK